jgi:hypothetical protein
MAATTKDRATIRKYIERQIRLTLKASSVIPAGVMVAIDTTAGTAVNAGDTASTRVMGVSAHAADQTKGDTDIVVERGAFWLGNDGTITAANIGGVCTVLDNQTVSLAATTTNDIGAGIIEDVDSVKGVLVAMLGGRVDAV